MVLGVPLCVNRFYAGEIRRYCERLLAVEARTAHVRLGLTYAFIVSGTWGICKGDAVRTSDVRPPTSDVCPRMPDLETARFCHNARDPSSSLGAGPSVVGKMTRVWMT